MSDDEREEDAPESVPTIVKSPKKVAKEKAAIGEGSTVVEKSSIRAQKRKPLGPYLENFFKGYIEPFQTPAEQEKHIISNLTSFDPVGFDKVLIYSPKATAADRSYFNKEQWVAGHANAREEWVTAIDRAKLEAAATVAKETTAAAATTAASAGETRKRGPTVKRTPEFDADCDQVHDRRAGDTVVVGYVDGNYRYPILCWRLTRDDLTQDNFWKASCKKRREHIMIVPPSQLSQLHRERLPASKGDALDFATYDSLSAPPNLIDHYSRKVQQASATTNDANRSGINAGDASTPIAHVRHA
jgi:hypothetical protein